MGQAASALLLLLFNLVWLATNLYYFLPLLISFFKKEAIQWKELEKYPMISVLLPAYHEPKFILAATLKSIFEADYPRECLEVLVVTQVDDEETNEAIADLQRKYPRLIQIIGDGKDGTTGKPAALNLGLKQARGKIVGVIDAEDLVEPFVFKKAAYRLEEGYVACQGILDMINEADGWRNLQFRAEYGHWFRIYLPSVARVGFPFPLGGTTNFFQRQFLLELGGWDAWNLTEDFELGLRLYIQGKKIAIIHSVTKEESPINWSDWLKQRTRWQRGKIQTLRKIIKGGKWHPRQVLPLFITLIWPHIGVINLAGVVTSVLVWNQLIWPWLSFLLWFNFVAILLYLLASSAGYLATQPKVGLASLCRSILVGITLPGYWFLQWLADLRAIKQEYFERRFYWEKTRHYGRHF